MVYIRHRRILLEKVADSARKAVKLAEPYKPYGIVNSTDQRSRYPCTLPSIVLTPRGGGGGEAEKERVLEGHQLVCLC